MPLSIVPASGYYDSSVGFSDQTFAIPESLSTGKDRIEHQTFLGASVRSFNITAGYGDSVTTLSVDLINDEYNLSDGTVQGDPNGDDIYHGGKYDRFAPPKTGSPVYFKFGKTKATINDAFSYTYNSIYNTNVYVGNSGESHICFGGILQSYTQNRGPAGNPLYSVDIVDPREILSNVELILNNYAGGTLNSKNMFNIYGFLEFNITKSLQDELSKLPGTPSFFRKITNQDGTYTFAGDDMHGSDIGPFSSASNDLGDNPKFFPITGTGFSRRSNQGIPFFRVAQGLNALLGIYGKLPQEYISAGFGSFINFRGFNYVVDLSGLKSLPPYYFLDFDKINLLDLCLEICEITNNELFVSLLPIIPNHPACDRFYQWNLANPSNFIAGIIRVDGIDKSFQPEYGSIKKYIDNLVAAGTPVENQDVGFELSNNVTDKFVVGAQQVDLYLFSANKDRDFIFMKKNDIDLSLQWRLGTSLTQQILPYYGLIGNKAVTIPKGFGAYQQILLDSSSLSANGVGNYYVATELELRASLVSYEKWSEFLLMYNDIYIENVDESYMVSVPRSVFDSEKNTFDEDDLPSSPCNPPYGYPLYYKRATKIGIQGAGLSSIYARFNRITTSIAELSGAQTTEQLEGIINNIWENLSASSPGDLTQAEREFILELQAIKKDILFLKKASVVGLVQRFEGGLSKTIKTMNRLSNKTKENAQKVYNFIRNIAEECLGKKFLIKIPNIANSEFSENIEYDDDTSEYKKGPFGFRPSINPIKVNFNPISDAYEFNYMPEKQGGYINFDLLNNISNQQSPAISQGLVPQDLTNFISENSRISAYVRFDHSENLSFNGVSSNDFTQQTILGKYFIPDINNYLDNVGDDRSNFVAFADKDSPQAKQIPKIPSVAFVKCDIDDKFYMPPKSSQLEPKVFATKIKDIKQYIPAVKEFDANTNKWIEISPARRDPYYIPDIDSEDPKDKDRKNDSGPFAFLDYDKFFKNEDGSVTSEKTLNLFFNRNSDGTIKSSLMDLDTNHIYALITLPSRISPTMDSRFRDGPQQAVNPLLLKHLLTMDVVRLPEFSEPNPVPFGGGGFDKASEAYKVALEKSINFALPNLLNFISPSPIYPDLVSIPLLSKERCYGPWISKVNNAGGKIEFIKDENLAPWNFSGYDLMNNAGKLQTEFTSSLLLQSERGGFVVPTIPAGLAIGKFLSNSGPLITNISLDVSDNGIKTTVKMDLYSISFGKLQKQKQDAIANVSRQKQKLTDERNALIRQGISKNQSNINYGLIYKYIKNQSIYNSMYSPSIPSQSSLVGSVRPPKNPNGAFGADNNGSDVEDYYAAGAIQSYEQLENISQNLPNTLDTITSFYDTAQQDLSEIYSPISMERHPNMPYVEDNNVNSNEHLYS